jgi:uncharacterized membrane protein YoaK (UPF0700 family)
MSTDYNTKTLEELVLEEKKLKKNRIFNALWIGFIVGIMVYRLVTRGFGFVAIAIPVILLAITLKNIIAQNKNLVELQKEIAKKNPA